MENKKSHSSLFVWGTNLNTLQPEGLNRSSEKKKLEGKTPKIKKGQLKDQMH